MRIATLIFSLLSFHAYGFEQPPSAAALYQEFKSARLAISEQGPSSIVRFVSREWLEDALESAFAASTKDHSKINYTRDVLWANFQGIGIISKVFGYSLKEGESGLYGLELKVENQCGSPFLVTYWYQKELNSYKIARKQSDSTTKGKAWRHANNAPIDTFPYFEALERSAVFSELFGKPIPRKDC